MFSYCGNRSVYIGSSSTFGYRIAGKYDRKGRYGEYTEFADLFVEDYVCGGLADWFGCTLLGIEIESVEHLGRTYTLKPRVGDGSPIFIKLTPFVFDSKLQVEIGGEGIPTKTYTVCTHKEEHAVLEQIAGYVDKVMPDTSTRYRVKRSVTDAIISAGFSVDSQFHKSFDLLDKEYYESYKITGEMPLSKHLSLFVEFERQIGLDAPHMLNVYLDENTDFWNERHEDMEYGYYDKLNELNTIMEITGDLGLVKKPYLSAVIPFVKTRWLYDEEYRPNDFWTVLNHGDVLSNLLKCVEEAKVYVEAVEKEFEENYEEPVQEEPVQEDELDSEFPEKVYFRIDDDCLFEDDDDGLLPF